MGIIPHISEHHHWHGYSDFCSLDFQHEMAKPVALELAGSGGVILLDTYQNQLTYKEVEAWPRPELSLDTAAS